MNIYDDLKVSKFMTNVFFLPTKIFNSFQNCINSNNLQFQKSKVNKCTMYMVRTYQAFYQAYLCTVIIYFTLNFYFFGSKLETLKQLKQQNFI